MLVYILNYLIVIIKVVSIKSMDGESVPAIKMLMK